MTDSRVNKIKLIFTAIIDLTLFILIFPPYFAIAFIIFGLFRRPADNGYRRSAMFLPSSGSIDEVKNKFGNLDILKELNPGGFFQCVHICYYPAKRNAKEHLANNMVLYDFRFDRYFKCLSTFCYMRGLMRILKNDERVSMIRSFSPFIVGFIGRIVSWIFRIPFCVSVHADDNKRYELLRQGGERLVFGSRRLAKALERFVYKNADLILPIRESLAKAAIKAGADENRTCVIPHGVDSNLFRLTEEEIKYFRSRVCPPGKTLVISVCRHSMDNYILDVIEIARLLHKKREDFRFIMLGNGVMYDEVKRRIAEYDLSDFVNAPGFVSRNDAVRYWQAGDIALCLMGGYSLIEAALAGKPVVSYDVEWHYELVKNAITGFLIKEGNKESAAQALHILMDEPALARQLGLNIRKAALQRHSLEAADEIKITCYKKLLKED